MAKVWKAVVLSRQQLGLDCQGPRMALARFAWGNLLWAVVDMAVLGIHSHVPRRREATVRGQTLTSEEILRKVAE